MDNDLDLKFLALGNSGVGKVIDVTYFLMINRCVCFEILEFFFLLIDLFTQSIC